MFLAKVLTGKTEARNSDRNLLGPSTSYDSVFGKQKLNDGSKHNIYIVYANKKAYPQYFIKYKI